jgi:hypothetical protein
MATRSSPSANAKAWASPPVTPLYVTEIIPETNTVVLGSKEDLDKQTALGASAQLPKMPCVGR